MLVVYRGYQFKPFNITKVVSFTCDILGYLQLLQGLWCQTVRSRQLLSLVYSPGLKKAVKVTGKCRRVWTANVGIEVIRRNSSDRLGEIHELLKLNSVIEGPQLWTLAER